MLFQLATALYILLLVYPCCNVKSHDALDCFHDKNLGVEPVIKLKAQAASWCYKILHFCVSQVGLLLDGVSNNKLLRRKQNI